MSHSFKLLLLAAGTLIACVVCAISLCWTKMGCTRSVSQSQRIHNACMDESLKEYEGICIDGAALIDFMETYEDTELYFIVKTKACAATQGVFYNRDDCNRVVGQYSRSISLLHEDYINQSAIFLCEVKLNENGVVAGIRFVQR